MPWIRLDSDGGAPITVRPPEQYVATSNGTGARYVGPMSFTAAATNGPVTINYANGPWQTLQPTSVSWDPVSQPPQSYQPARPEGLEEAQAAVARAAEERRQRQREYQEQRTRERREWEEQRRATQARAQVLLRRHLSDEQREMYDAYGFFEVQVGQRTYRLTEGREGNVLLMVDGHAVASFCIHPDEYLPPADQQLTQLLWLETQEARFLEVAIASRVVPGVEIPPALCDTPAQEEEAAEEEAA